MIRMKRTVTIPVGIWVLCTLTAGSVFGNGGPFVVKYPGGDPAAKGVLARLDPDLRPGRETRLRVVKEDLKATFGKHPGRTDTPLVQVSAEYTIENPTQGDIEVDFGFPILRGIYVEVGTMGEMPVAVQVRLGEKHLRSAIISNSAIYGIIRQRAREVIEKALAENQELGGLVASVRKAEGEAREAARQALSAYLAGGMKWNERDAALMVEYASLELGQLKSNPPDRHSSSRGWNMGGELNEIHNANLGSLSAIGEQKATQFFAQLASRFDAEAAAAYEKIFSAWGGDVREQSVDIETGTVRPREVTVEAKDLGKPGHIGAGDPTIYARVDYLDPKAKITEAEKASCGIILKNLPVVFTFAPMNILHYQAKFPAQSTQILSVSYSQYAYVDSRAPSSYQLAYVVHPASFWDNFGPINLEVAVPEGVRFQASVPCRKGGVEDRAIVLHGSEKALCEIYRAELKQKTGELYLAVDADGWKNGGKQAAINRLDNVTQKAAQQMK